MPSHPLSLNTLLQPVQASTSTGSHRGPHILAVAAGGGTSSSSTTSRRPAFSVPRNRSRATSRSSAICGGGNQVCIPSFLASRTVPFCSFPSAEFHLVAGGEELFQENGLLAHSDKNSNASPSPSVSPGRVELHESPAASSSSTPEYPTSEFPSDVQTASFPSLSPPSQLSPFSELGVEDVFRSPPSSTRLSDPAFGCLSSSPRTTHSITPVSVKLEPLAMDPSLFTLPQPSFADSPADYTLSAPNRISHLYFWADGMVPLTLDVDRLVGATPSSPSRTFLHFRVSMPPLADLRCPPNLQGVNGAVSFASSWTSLAKCQTKSWGLGRTVISQDLGLFTQVTTPELQSTLAADPTSSQMVYAYLPDSALSRCHWLDNGELDSIPRVLRKGRRQLPGHATTTC